MRVAWEMDHQVHSANPVLEMNYAEEAIQRVTRLNLDIHVPVDGRASAMADKLVRDGIIWTHLAGDSTQRLKAMRRLKQ